MKNTTKKENTSVQNEVLRKITQIGVKAEWRGDRLYVNTKNDYVKFYYRFNKADILFGACPCLRIDDPSISDSLVNQAKADYRQTSMYKMVDQIVKSYDVWEEGCVEAVNDQSPQYWLAMLDKNIDSQYKNMVASAYTKAKAGEDFSEYECAILYKAIKSLSPNTKLF